MAPSLNDYTALLKGVAHKSGTDAYGLNYFAYIGRNADFLLTWLAQYLAGISLRKKAYKIFKQR